MELPFADIGGLSTSDARSRNLAAVFDAIREHPGGSRKEIGQRMPFSLQTMTNVVQELIDIGLVAEVERGGERGRGNPHRGLQVVSRRSHALGVQIRWNACLVSLVDLAFGEVERTTYPIDADVGDTEGYLAALESLLCRLVQQHRGSDIWGIGLSGPLPIELPNIPAHDLDEPIWADQRWFRAFWSNCSMERLRNRLERGTGLRVRLLNNPQAAALAQARLLPPDARFVYVLAGLGLGAAFINRRGLSRDLWPHGGEIGHVIFRDRTLSSVLSASSLRQSLAMDLPQGAMEAALERLAIERPQAFTPWLNEAAPILRFVVNFIEAAIWPDGIALGGFLPDRLLDLLIARALPLSDSVVMREGDPRRGMHRLFRGASGAAAIPYGAAISVLSARTNPDFPGHIAVRRALA